jgi:phosphoglycolate phosphatase
LKIPSFFRHVEISEYQQGRRSPTWHLHQQAGKITYPVLDAQGLRDYFPAIVCGDTLPYSKPDARHVHRVIDMLGADAADAVFIGDSETDIAAARNAGLPIVLVSYGYTLSPPEEPGADVLI